MATRVWICRQLCDFWDLDPALYVGWDMPYNDCAALPAMDQQAIIAVTDMGLMNGVGDSVFAPDGKLTRAQAAALLWRMLDSPAIPDDLPPTFQIQYYLDVTSDMWFYDAVQYLSFRGVLPPTEYFYPSEIVSRKDISEWLELLDQLRANAVVSNIHFEVQGGLPVLAWDCNETGRINFQVFLRSVDGSWREIGNSHVKEVFPVIAGPGNWRGIGVEASDAQTRTYLGAAENPFLSIHVTDQGLSSVRPVIQVTNQDNQKFTVAISGMTGFSTYSISFRNPANPQDGRGCFWFLTGGGSGDRSINGNPTIFLPPNGECRLVGGANYSLSGNTLSYDYYTLRSWSNAPL